MPACADCASGAGAHTLSWQFPAESLSMSLTYSIDPAAGVVELRYFGRQDFAEWSAVMYAILEDPAFAEGYGFLSDRRLVSEVPTTDFVQATLTFLRTHQARLGASRWAAIVNDAASYGMGRMAQQLGEALPFPIEIFTDPGRAHRWVREGGELEQTSFT